MRRGRDILVQAHAKINLTLEVLSKRKDGYHNIVSVMQSISLHDRLYLRVGTDGITVDCDHPGVPAGKENLVYKAAEKLRAYAGVRDGASIKIHKGIPVAAGLAGGSADAAAALLGLNRLWGTNYDAGRLIALAKELGADIPFCIVGGTALARGIGEELTRLPALPKIWLVLVKPPFGVSTKEVYERYDSMKIGYRPNHELLLKALEKGERGSVIAGIGNVLERVTVSLYPEVQEIIDYLQKLGSEKVFMCGSGPTVCAVVENEQKAKNIRSKFSGYPGEVYTAYTLDRGSVVIRRSKGGRTWKRKNLHR